MARRADDHRTCGPECPYRGLYEGSQASLADMARRQADALRRVGRLRNALVLALKRHFPDKFSRAESGLGSRLSEADDEILLAYLSAFLGASPLDNQLQATAGAADLREALRLRGITVTGDDLRDWARQIRENVTAPPRSTSVPHAAPPVNTVHGTTADNARPAEAHRRPDLPHRDPVVGSSGPDSDPGVRPTSVPASLGHLFMDEQQSPGLGELFDENPRVTIGRDVQPARVSTDGPALGDLFLMPVPAAVPQDPTGRWSPSPLLPVRKEADPETDSRSALQPDEGPVPAQVDDPTRNDQGGRRTDHAPRDDRGDGFAAVAPITNHDGSGEQHSGSVTPEEGRLARPEEAAPVDTVAAGWLDPFEQPSRGAVETPSGDRSAKSSEDAGSSEGQDQTARPSQEESIPIPLIAPAGPGYEAPLRPELFTPVKTPRTTRRGGRTVRQRAERPDPMLLDIPVETGPQPELSEDLRQRLTAAALLPRPVFTSDLVAIAGSAEVVGVWEGDLRAEPATSPVRFLAAKGRHRLRGSLVVPVERSTAKGTRPDWWADCVERYRGSRLYELGVLLHRVGEEVVSAQFDEHAALLRLNSARGIVGVIVIFENIATETLAQAALERLMSQLLGERCSLVAVLTTAGDAPAITALGDGIANLALVKNWRPQFPVITARSWEFADDRGSTATLILGG